MRILPANWRVILGDTVVVIAIAGGITVYVFGCVWLCTLMAHSIAHYWSN